MEKLINDKLTEQKSLKADSKELKSWITNSNMWNWIYSVFKINGQGLKKSAVVDLLDGKIREDIPLSCYGYVQNFKAVYNDMLSEISMQSTPDIRMFKRWCEMLFGHCDFRKNNPVVYEYGLIPCHFNSIEEELTEALKEYSRSSRDEVASATKLFLDVLKIYPFDEESTDAAALLLLYCLLFRGLPVPEFSAFGEEFCQMISVYMDKGNAADFYDMMLRCLYNRLDTIVLYTKQALENQNENN